MGRRVRIWVLLCKGAFKDVFASYSEASREAAGCPDCEIRGPFDREDY